MFSQNDLELMVQKWFAEGGDNRFRYSYDLLEDSIVFDIGAYMGKWSKKIYDLYHCDIHAFEPVNEFYNIASSDPQYGAIHWYNFGVGSKNQEIDIVLDADGSSVFKKEGEKERIKIKSLSSVIKFFNIQEIQLMKINIEGGEYDLLDHILEMDFQSSIRNIQIQFHINVPDCDGKRDSIRKKLSDSHFLTYDYPFVWENWKIK